MQPASNNSCMAQFIKSAWFLADKLFLNAQQAVLAKMEF
jgi:hypothetical protein